MLSLRRSGKIALLWVVWKPAEAWAHASDQAFVLLLPTDFYMSAGVAAVAATMVILGLFPKLVGASLFKSRPVFFIPKWFRKPGLRIGFAGILMSLVLAGLTGSRDPLVNPLPLFVFTVWWIGLVNLAGLVGNFWVAINPFAWVGGTGLMRLPERLGWMPGILALMIFALYLLADLAPDDPARLAQAIVLYAFYAIGGTLLFGQKDWLERGDAIAMLMRCYGWMAALGARGEVVRVGLPGWQLVDRQNISVSCGVFVLVLLGTGSFDGLNETFWWLALLGVNPLEFPGRSAVFWQTIGGYLAFNLGLVAAFSGCVWAGFWLVSKQVRFKEVFGPLSLAILPIALAYHFAHYLVSALVNGQYAIAAFSDPFGYGWDLLGLGQHYVTTGFLNSQDSVRVIWLSQAGAVVIGHVISVLVGHAIAHRLLGDARKAAISQIPLSIFMVGFTLFGLWLLASPRGA